jgi:signal transduction histidine kinase
MKRALSISAVACAFGAGAVYLLLGLHAAMETLAMLLAVSLMALAAAVAVARSRRRIGSISRQLALAVAIAIVAVLAAVWLAAAVMFISDEDAWLVSVMATVIAVVGMSVATSLTAPLVHDIEKLRDRLSAVGAGDRRTRLAAAGNDELTELTAAANAMIEQLSTEEAGRLAAEDARQRLIVAVSHDLRTPVASLRALTEAIEDGIATGATRTRYLHQMQTHVAILSSLIEDLFTLTRAQAGEINLETRPVEIGDLVSETVAAMQPAAHERGVALHAVAPATPAPGLTLAARADADQLRRVLMNLLDNAIRHTPGGGEVTVRARRRGRTVEVEVADTGTGIPAADRRHAFDAFFRGGEHTSRSDAGAGLGLAIAQAIIQAHEGEIWLAPSQRGTRVCFTLPAPDLPATAQRETTPSSV